jgi:pimeloyl-ACP methyl ester carboxylesterase
VIDPHVAGAERAVLDARVDVGGLALHIHCEGEGLPAVVFDSGLGLDGSGWFDAEVPVGRATATFTRACAYDRAGRGQSDPPASRPHSNRQMSKELFALLQNAGERPPFVLVGHSMQAQRPLGALSTNSAFVIVPDSGHHIPNDAPKVVIRAVEAVVNAVRSGERLDAATLL